MSIVEEYIEELVTQYKKRRRAIPPDEFRQMLKNLVENCRAISLIYGSRKDSEFLLIKETAILWSQNIKSLYNE